MSRRRRCRHRRLLEERKKKKARKGKEKKRRKHTHAQTLRYLLVCRWHWPASSAHAPQIDSQRVSHDARGGFDSEQVGGENLAQEQGEGTQYTCIYYTYGCIALLLFPFSLRRARDNQPNKQTAAASADRLTWCRLGCCTLTATGVPSRSLARCTWPSPTGLRAQRKTIAAAVDNE